MNRFANSMETVPVPCRVFGTALRPFSLGHHLLFTRLSLPFADNPKAEGSQLQLEQAVFLCAHSYEENLDGLLNGEWAKAFEKWRKRVQKTKPDYITSAEVFESHLTTAYQIAPIWRHATKADAISLSAPWEELLKCRLVMGGFALTEVLNGYLPERWYDYFTVMELNLAQTCQSPKDWKQIFYTENDALQAEADREAA